MVIIMDMDEDPTCFTITMRSSPKALFDICLESVAHKINKFLDEQGMFHKLPPVVCNLITEKVFQVGTIQHDNYRRILNGKTRNVVCWKDKCSGIKDPVGFLQHLQDVCKNVVKVDLEALSSTMKHIDPKLIARALSIMVHLEWVNLKDCRIDDECLKYIGSKCIKLKHLNLTGNPSITVVGIQALCYPDNVPYGNCTQLTHVDLNGQRYQGKAVGTLPSPEAVSLFLLHCPNLEFLWYPHTTAAIAEAILVLSGEGTDDWRSSFDEDVGLDEFELLFDKVAALPLQTLCKLRTFKLKHLNLTWFDESDYILTEALSKVLGRFCPLIEDLCLERPVLQTTSLCGFHQLPLKSVSVVEPSSETEYLDRHDLGVGVVRLLRSVGSSLHTLNFEVNFRFDLRIISSLCPNLKTLELDCNGDTSRQSETWPAPLSGKLSDVRFKFLTHLTVLSTVISDEDVVTLLSSPNLEFVKFADYDDYGIACSVRYIQQTLLRFPTAFSKLRHVLFAAVKMDREFVFEFAAKAVALESIAFEMCYSIEDGREVDYEKEDFARLPVLCSHKRAV